MLMALGDSDWTESETLEHAFGVRYTINNQLRTGTDKGNLTV